MLLLHGAHCFPFLQHPLWLGEPQASFSQCVQSESDGSNLGGRSSVPCTAGDTGWCLLSAWAAGRGGRARAQHTRAQAAGRGEKVAGEGGRERALRFGHQETTGCQGPAELPRDPESLPRSPSKAKAQTRTRGVHVDFTTKDTCARIQNKMCVRTDSQTALAMRATCCKERPPKQSRSHGALRTPRTVGASQAPGSASRPSPRVPVTPAPDGGRSRSCSPRSWTLGSHPGNPAPQRADAKRPHCQALRQHQVLPAKVGTHHRAQEHVRPASTPAAPPGPPGQAPGMWCSGEPGP